MHKIKVLDVYSDKGISGRTTEHRAAFSKLLRDVTKKKVELIVVYSISRAGRNLKDLINNVDHLAKHGCSLVSLSENLDFSSSVGKMILGILGSLAEWQSSQIKESVMLSKLSLLKSGKPSTGSLPYRRYVYEAGALNRPDKGQARVIGDDVVENERNKGY